MNIRPSSWEEAAPGWLRMSRRGGGGERSDYYPREGRADTEMGESRLPIIGCGLLADGGWR